MTATSAKNPANYTMTVVTATDGRRAEMPAKFVNGKSQKALDTLVCDAHNDNPVSRAVCAAMAMRAV